MTPPKTEGLSTIRAKAPEGSSAVSLCPGGSLRALITLRKRSDFLRAASARRQGTGGFLVQARDRADGSEAIRIGFTASKKVGNAVLRNRSKRRLRALAAAILSRQGVPGWDYVLVAKPGATPDRPFALMAEELSRALGQIHRTPAP